MSALMTTPTYEEHRYGIGTMSARLGITIRANARRVRRYRAALDERTARIGAAWLSRQQSRAGLYPIGRPTIAVHASLDPMQIGSLWLKQRVIVRDAAFDRWLGDSAREIDANDDELVIGIPVPSGPLIVVDDLRQAMRLLEEHRCSDYCGHVGP